MTEQNPRDVILNRIANLRARAEDDAASEAEAMTALKFASKLMEAYAVTEAELAIAENEGRIIFEVITKRVKQRILTGSHRHKVQMCLSGIEAFTSTKCVIHSGYAQLSWVGDKPDVEMAVYLTDMLSLAIDREYKNWCRSQLGIGRGAKSSFQTAMAYRISTRLHDLAKETKEERKQQAENAKRLQDKSSSTALVIVDAMERKEEEVETTFRAEFPKLGRARSMNLNRNNWNAYSAGHEAGNRVNFGRPVESQTQGRLSA